MFFSFAEEHECAATPLAARAPNPCEPTEYRHSPRLSRDLKRGAPSSRLRSEPACIRVSVTQEPADESEATRRDKGENPRNLDEPELVRGRRCRRVGDGDRTRLAGGSRLATPRTRLTYHRRGSAPRVGARSVALLSEPLSFSTVRSPDGDTHETSARAIRSEIGRRTTAPLGSEALHEQALVRALGCGRDGRLR